MSTNNRDDYDNYLTSGDPGHYPESSGDVVTMADEVREENHGTCPVCKADICLADGVDNVGRENCPCDGESPPPVMTVDGEDVCSDACCSTWEAEGRADE